MILNIGGLNYLKNSSYNINFDECFVNGDIYKKTDTGIITMNVFSFSLVNANSERGLSYFSNHEWFQRKTVFKRIPPFEMEVIVPTFKIIDGKKFMLEDTMDWFTRKFRTVEGLPTYTF